MPKLQEFRKKFHVNIPPALVTAKGWKSGQELIFEFDAKGNLILKEK